MRPQGIDMCSRATYRRKRRGEMGDPWGVSTETGEEMFGSLGRLGYKFFPKGKRIPSRPCRRTRGRPGV